MQEIQMSWQWIAGFFEGEGSVYWIKPKPNSKQSSNRSEGKRTINTDSQFFENGRAESGLYNFTQTK